MQSRRNVFLVGALLGALSSVLAQPSADFGDLDDEPEEPVPQGGETVRSELDSDEDGYVSLVEYSSQNSAEFAKRDKDKSGKLSQAEIYGDIEDGRLGGSKMDATAARLQFARFDEDADGGVDLKEFAGVIKSEFDLYDVDDDGRLDKLEVYQGSVALDQRFVEEEMKQVYEYTAQIARDIEELHKEGGDLRSYVMMSLAATMVKYEGIVQAGQEQVAAVSAQLAECQAKASSAGGAAGAFTAELSSNPELKNMLQSDEMKQRILNNPMVQKYLEDNPSFKSQIATPEGWQKMLDMMSGAAPSLKDEI